MSAPGRSGTVRLTAAQALVRWLAALRVEAVGFRRWEGLWLGVLITPWFMNLMLLPCAATEHTWPQVRYGESLAYRLPAGVFEFIRANVREPDKVIGDIRAQVAATHAAASRLAAIMDEAQLDGLGGLAGEIIRLARVSALPWLCPAPMAGI